MGVTRERLIVFEDAGCRHFAPLTHTRPVYELLLGAMSLRERCEHAFDSTAELICRPHLSPHLAATTGRRVNDLIADRDPRPLLLLNGRVADPHAVQELVGAHGEPAVYMNGDVLVAARILPDLAPGLMINLEANGFLLDPGMLKMPMQHVATPRLVNALWELPLLNGEFITSDVERWGPTPSVDLPAGVHRTGDSALVLAAGAELDPGVVLDLRAGPIVIGRGARVAGLSRLEGPLAIGAGTQIAGGRIRAGTTLGPQCRIVGEVEAAIFHGYANKAHDGFIGHAYIGEWVNLGAMTTNSDLKNTYGTVKVWRDGNLIDTGEKKVGAMIGDHVKTGIGTLLDTGAIIGMVANIYGGSAVLASKWFPSFSWGAPPKLTLHDPERALVTMAEVMRRRGVALTDEYRDLIDATFDLTRPERNFAGIRDL
jgi:UDP-N-acetylglucosamine diphosphorylase/glucosamine-1-phosphate N-acetyltransferase